MQRICKSWNLILRNCREYRAVRLADGNQTICVDSNEAFRIGINATDRRDQETYGAVLFLDGQRVHGKKTFHGKTMFYGFKKGGGMYTEFLFNAPGFQDPEEASRKQVNTNGNNYGNSRGKPEEQQLDDKHAGKKGSIIIEFYETTQMERRRPMQQGLTHTKTYESNFITDDSKKSLNSVRIGQGKDFSIGGPQQPDQMRKRDQKY